MVKSMVEGLIIKRIDLKNKTRYKRQQDLPCREGALNTSNKK